MHPPQVVERNGLLLACAASASRIWPWPVCRSSFSGEPLAQRDNNFPFLVARFHVLLRLIGSAPGRRNTRSVFGLKISVARRAGVRPVRGSVCSIALLLVCLDWKSDSFSYRAPSPLRFQSCNTTFLMTRTLRATDVEGLFVLQKGKRRIATRKRLGFWNF